MKVLIIFANNLNLHPQSYFKEIKEYYSISSYDVLKDISKLYNYSKENKLEISDFKVKETSLEEVFIHLIKEDSISMGGLEK